jgi:hypothetical protein
LLAFLLVYLSHRCEESNIHADFLLIFDSCRSTSKPLIFNGFFVCWDRRGTNISPSAPSARPSESQLHFHQQLDFATTHQNCGFFNPSRKPCSASRESCGLKRVASADGESGGAFVSLQKGAYRSCARATQLLQ